MRNFTFLSFTGPSGAGKTEIQNALVARATNLEIVISNTTRSPRPSDKPGAYRYGSLAALAEEEISNDVAWKKEFGGEWYWTRKTDLAAVIKSGQLATIILLPETVPILTQLYPGRLLPIWVIPPEEGALRRRLTRRGDDPDKIEAVLAESLAWEPDPRIPYEFLGNDQALQYTLADLLEILGRKHFPIQLR